MICNRVGTHIAALNKVCTNAARTILPVYRTTPTQVLLREAGLDPAEIALDNIGRRAAVRIRRLDHQHPLYQRVDKLCLNLTLSRFARTAISIPPSEKANPIFHPPWEIVETRNNPIFSPNTASSSDEPRTNIFQEFLNTLPKNDIQVYSDGSKLPNGNLGAGFAILQHGCLVASGASSLGKSCEVDDAEVQAALQGIKAAIALPYTRFSKDMWVFTDNRNVANKFLSKTPVLSSQSIYLEALETIKLWKARDRLPHILEGEIRICWVPSHAGIYGNELADSEAKRGADMPFNGSTQKLSFSSLKQWQKRKARESRNRWWQTEAHQKYTDLEIKSAPLPPKELLTNRKFLGQLIAARTGHGDFANYHIRFKHRDAVLRCNCGSQKSQLHFFFCRILRRRGGRPPGPISSLVPTLLGTPEGAVTLSEWLGKANFFIDICPR